MLKQLATSVFFTVRMPRSAEMADKKMGMLQLLLRLGVFMYIVLFVMIFKKGYCARVPLTGSMRLTIRPPISPIQAALRSRPKLPDYCCNGSPDACAPNGKENFPNDFIVRRKCWFVDDNFAAITVGSQSATLATRIQRYPQSNLQQCSSPESIDCWNGWSPDSKNPTDDIYVAYAENFTMSMTHGFSIKAPGTNAPQYFDLTGTWGKLVYTDDKDQQQFIDPCVGFDNKDLCVAASSSIGNADGNSSDIVTIGMLLYAARILDQVDAPCRRVDFLKGSGDPTYIDGFGYPCFEVSGQEVSNINKRDLGLTLNIIITYKNTYGENEWGFVPSKPVSKDVTYTVEAKYKNGAGYSEKRQIMNQSLTSRVYDSIKGIKINIVQTGTILIPDGVTTILNLMTGMGLLGVAAVIVSVLVESVLPIIQSRCGKRLGLTELSYAKAKAKAVKQIDSDARMSLNSIISKRRNSAEELMEAEEDSERIHTGLSMIGRKTTQDGRVEI